MGFLADEAGALLSKLGGPQDQHNLLSSILGLINRPEVGGVSGLVDKFKAAGLGHIADVTKVHLLSQRLLRKVVQFIRRRQRRLSAEACR